MPEYIEREALRAEALRLTGQSEFAFDHCFPYWQFSKCIKEAPSVDVVPVVRCKDCAKRNTPMCHAGHEQADTDFCSHGERKDDTNAK